MKPPPAKIPFNELDFSGNERRYVEEALMRNRHTSGDGPFTKKCQALLEEALGAPRVLLTTSGTHALEMCALLLGLGEGDEFIVPSYTFSSTANAFLLRGMRPIFVDVRPDTFNLDERQLEARLTSRTRLIVPVHYAGVACDMEPILSFASRHGLAVVEDNAHGLFGRYRGKALGTFGVLGAQSFHETKNFSSGEGGAIVLNDPLLVERAEILREKGTNRSRFFRGQVDKYGWVDVGSSFVPSDVLAAILYAQLERRDAIQARRRQIWTRYRDELSGWAAENGVQLPFVPDHCEQTYHMFYLVLPRLEDRTALIEHLGQRGVKAVFHYQPLHSSEMGRRLGTDDSSCPVTDRAGDCLVRLPMFTQLSDESLAHVIGSVREFAVPASGSARWRKAG